MTWRGIGASRSPRRLPPGRHPPQGRSGFGASSGHRGEFDIAAGARLQPAFLLAAAYACPSSASATVAQAALGAVLQADVAAVTAHDAARDGEPEPAAAGVAATRRFQPHKGLEHPLQVFLRDPRTFVLDDNAEFVSVPLDPRRYLPAVGGRVLQQVAQRPAQRRGPAGDQDPPGVRDRDVVAELREIGSDAVDQGMQVDGAGFFPLHVLADKVLANARRVDGNPYIIVGTGEGMHLTDLQKPWRRVRKAAGLDDVRIHDLRHTSASEAVMGGESLPMVGKILGHT